MPTPKKHNSNAQRQAAYRKRQELARQIERQQKGLPPLSAIPTMPGTRRWTHMLEQARILVDTVKQEREDYYDERSEAWQPVRATEAPISNNATKRLTLFLTPSMDWTHSDATAAEGVKAPPKTNPNKPAYETTAVRFLNEATTTPK